MGEEDQEFGNREVPAKEQVIASVQCWGDVA